MTMKALLTENIHAEAAAALTRAGADPVERLTTALDPEELAARVSDVALLGLRSRTKLTADAVARAEALLAVGCFSIGTNQVDLAAAQAKAIPVFNSPFANSRSVAELTIAAAIFLMRRIPERMAQMRRGEWIKTAQGAHEVRAKKLGIVGYGNIGSQLSVIASGLGMHVYFFDIEAKLRHGNARATDSLHELLGLADVVTLHVPSTPLTRGMIDADAIAAMKDGAALINYARGDLVDIDALAAALRSGKLSGAAVDVFPQEPSGADEPFQSPLRDLDSAILSPHIGGSTQEAQQAIGREVADKLIAFAHEGATAGAVNFPEVSMGPLKPGRLRLTHAHVNAPGVLQALNELIGGAGLNIAAQSLATQGELGYVVTDIEGDAPATLARQAAAAPHTLRVRVLRPRSAGGAAADEVLAAGAA